MGSHWDLCFVYDTDGSGVTNLSAKAPYAEAAYYRLDALPRDSMAEDHLEVLDGLNSTQQQQ